eukprot:m.68730 g.68730  ORF g.68730 m.68730 type:complete len:137 (-) comp11995_c0_seq1:792-1202(-)
MACARRAGPIIRSLKKLNPIGVISSASALNSPTVQTERQIGTMSSTFPKKKLKIDWNDTSTPWDLMYSVLKWGDTAAGQWYVEPGMPAAVNEMYDIWQNNAVTRANSYILNTPNHKWQLRLLLAPGVRGLVRVPGI